MKSMLVPIVVVLMCAFFCQANEPPQKLFEMMYGLDNATSIERLEQLIKQGADVNSPIGFDRMLLEGEDPASPSRVGTTWPLDVAVQRSRLDMVTLLLKLGAKLHGTELPAAALHGQGDQTLEIAKALLKAGTDPNAKYNGSAALHWAAYKNNKELGKLLLAQRGIELNTFDDDSHTPLMWAVERGSLDMVEMLLQEGASPHIKNDQGVTATTMLQQSIDQQQKILSAMKSSDK